MKALLLLAVAALIIFLTARHLHGGKNSIHSAPATDGDVIDQLKAVGSDLSRPHSIDFYLYFPGQDAANRVSSLLSSKGYETSVEPSASDAPWLVLAKRQLVPTATTLIQIRTEFTAIASSEGGEYDGWEAAVVR